LKFFNDLKTDALSSIPAEFWEALKAEFLPSMRDNKNYLAASGWTRPFQNLVVSILRMKWLRKNRYRGFAR